jgi:hypothetical protein
MQRHASRIQPDDARSQPLSYVIVFGGELNDSVHEINWLAQL